VSTLKLPNLASATPKPVRGASPGYPAKKPTSSGARAKVQAKVRLQQHIAQGSSTPSPNHSPADASRQSAYARPSYNANTGGSDSYGERSRFTPRNTPKSSGLTTSLTDDSPRRHKVDTGFYGTGMSFRDSAHRRVEQKQSKLARQSGDTPARNYDKDLPQSRYDRPSQSTQAFVSATHAESDADDNARRTPSQPKPWQGGPRDNNYRDPRAKNPYDTRPDSSVRGPRYEPAKKVHRGEYAPPPRINKIVAQDDIHALQPFFASCPRGLEWALVQELEAMDINVVQRVASGAMLQASWQQIAQANLRSRVASRFLWQLSTQNVRGEEDIYAQASRVPWEKFFNYNATIKVDTVGIRAEVRSLEFVTLRVKDAICDRFRSIDGNRPSVNTAQPDMRVMCVLDGLYSQIYLDTTGEPLFKRGWRNAMDSKGEAPLKENLAAGLLALTEWRAGTPLYDPMCGSGTLIVEAAQRAYGIAPGGPRAQAGQFAMQKFLHLTLSKTDYTVPEQEVRPPMLFASDINPEMVQIAAHNIQTAGLNGEAVQLACIDVLEITPPCEQPGLLVLNPPYGERMGFAENIDADAFYDAFAANLKRNFKGWSVWLLTSDEQVQARMRLKPNATHAVFNGAIACRWIKFDIT
jgi:putative N6-adenine-specific DNA methylase